MYFIVGYPKQISLVNNLEPLSASKLKSQVKIAVIDDAGLNASLKDKLQKLGYQIQYFDDIFNLETVKAFDVIFCDIRGVGKSLNDTYEGAYLIKELRKQYPTKYLVAFTGSDIDRKYNSFIMSADAFLEKDSGSEKWTEFIDIALESQANPFFQWKRLMRYLVEKNLNSSTIMRIEDEFVDAILSKKTFPSRKLVSAISSKEIIEALSAIATLISIIRGA